MSPRPPVVKDIWISRGTAGHPRGVTIRILRVTATGVQYRVVSGGATTKRGKTYNVLLEAFLRQYVPQRP